MTWPRCDLPAEPSSDSQGYERRHRGIEVVKIQSPYAYACAAQFVLITRLEVTDRLLVFGQRHLRAILAKYEARTTDNALIVVSPHPPPARPPCRGPSPWGGSYADLSSAVSLNEYGRTA